MFLNCALHQIQCLSQEHNCPPKATEPLQLPPLGSGTVYLRTLGLYSTSQDLKSFNKKLKNHHFTIS